MLERNAQQSLLHAMVCFGCADDEPLFGGERLAATSSHRETLLNAGSGLLCGKTNECSSSSETDSGGHAARGELIEVTLVDPVIDELKESLDCGPVVTAP